MIDYKELCSFSTVGAERALATRKNWRKKVRNYGPHGLVPTKSELFNSPKKAGDKLWKYNRVIEQLRKMRLRNTQLPCPTTLPQRALARLTNKCLDILDIETRALMWPSYGSEATHFLANDSMKNIGVGSDFELVEIGGLSNPAETFDMPVVGRSRYRPIHCFDKRSDNRWIECKVWLAFTSESSGYIKTKSVGQLDQTLVVMTEFTSLLTRHLHDVADVWRGRYVYGGYNFNGESDYTELEPGIRKYTVMYFDVKKQTSEYVTLVCDKQFVYPRMGHDHVDSRLLAGYKRAKAKKTLEQMGV